ncbi:hypothetical protein [Antarcticirhabdus aurantiaca]|uniref:Uncharacterized protein n=1 Tax=Antarcticirhabdus aurantiaca TaxID=2606717 RepID=A0ACD4NME8_9HYPH|nr:hypothetical protein OXU80_24940 [Jeongeuplla avenae]
MRVKALMLASLAFIASAPLNASAQSLCELLSGAAVIARDGTYLGEISSEFSSNSILNEFGSHGSEFASDSIWNEFGQHGGEFSQYSPFNPYTSTPPIIVKGGQAVALLSVNGAPEAVNPYALKTCQ